MHGLLHRVGNIVELQVQKDLMSPCLNFPNNVRAFRIVQLHTDFHIRLPSVKLIQKGKGLLLVFKIQCNDNVLCHSRFLLYSTRVISVSRSMPSFSISCGKVSMMVLHA